ncbi:MAG: phage tail assembly chaperone, partial [Lachnospirales bacterium]
MKSFNGFMKENRKVRENTFYIASDELLDENGEAYKWEIRPLTSKQLEKLREKCTKEVQIKGKPGQYREKLDSELYAKKLACESIVFPDLHNSG